jgi:hypothetical protein
MQDYKLFIPFYSSGSGALEKASICGKKAEKKIHYCLQASKI